MAEGREPDDPAHYYLKQKKLQPKQSPAKKQLTAQTIPKQLTAQTIPKQLTAQPIPRLTARTVENPLRHRPAPPPPLPNQPNEPNNGRRIPKRAKTINEDYSATVNVGGIVKPSPHQGITWNVGYKKGRLGKDGKAVHWQTVMVRVIDCDKCTTEYAKTVAKEMAFLKKLQHRLIVCVFCSSIFLHVFF